MSKEEIIAALQAKFGGIPSDTISGIAEKLAKTADPSATDARALFPRLSVSEHLPVPLSASYLYSSLFFHPLYLSFTVIHVTSNSLCKSDGFIISCKYHLTCRLYHNVLITRSSTASSIGFEICAFIPASMLL